MKCLCFDALAQCGVVPVYLCVCGSPNYTMERKSFLYQSFPLAFVQSIGGSFESKGVQNTDT